jgi:hypothetical protein
LPMLTPRVVMATDLALGRRIMGWLLALLSPATREMGSAAGPSH